MKMIRLCLCVTLIAATAGNAQAVRQTTAATDTALTMDLARQIATSNRAMDSLRRTNPRLPDPGPLGPKSDPAKLAATLTASPELTAAITRAGLTPARYANGYVRIYKGWMKLMFHDFMQELLTSGRMTMPEGQSPPTMDTDRDMEFVGAHEDELRALGFTAPPVPLSREERSGGGAP